MTNMPSGVAPASLSTLAYPTSSTNTVGAADATATQEVNPTKEPLATEQASSTTKLSKQEQLSKVKDEAKNLQELANMQKTSLQFSVDDSSKQVVVKVIDTTTDKVITQIPSEDALARSKKLDDLIGRLLSVKT